MTASYARVTARIRNSGHDDRLPASNGHPLQRFLAFTSPYPNGGVEIRLVHQVPPEQP